jgi:hypothetical protein
MSFDKAPRKKSLLKHPLSPSMSERQEVRLLTKQLRKLENAEPTPENINLMLRLSQRIGKLRDGVKRRKNPPVLGRPVGRPKTVKPVQPEVVDPITAVLEAERLERERVATETPEPSIVFEHARRAEVKAEIKKEREVVKNPPITAPQSDVQEAGDGITPPNQSGFTVVSPGLLDMFKTVNRSLDSDEHDGSVGMTNALLRDFERAPSPETVESGYLAEWNWVPQKW